MSRVLQHILSADTAFETDTPLSPKEAVGFLLVSGGILAVAFLMKLELFAMIAVFGVLGIMIVLRSPMTWLVLSLAGFLPVMWELTEEFTVLEGAHAALMYGGLLWWFFHRLVITREPLRWSLGGILISALTLQMVALTLLSRGYAAVPIMIIRELTVHATTLLFIPIAHEADTRLKKKLIAGTLIAVILLLSLKNIWMYQQKVMEAVYFWQVGARRATESFYFILVTMIVGAAMMVSSWRVTSWLFWVGVFVAGTGAVILSFFRTLWLGAFFAIPMIAFVVRGSFWKRSLSYLSIAAFVVVSLYPIVLQDVIPIDVMWRSLSSRFESIGSYSQDISVRNRDVESMAVLEDIGGNWVLGKGLSTEIVFFKIATWQTIKTTWTHNGYPWLLNHIGILGLLLFVGAYGAYIRLGLRINQRLKTLEGIEEHIRFRWRSIIGCGIALIGVIFVISYTNNTFLSREAGATLAVVFGLFDAWKHELSVGLGTGKDPGASQVVAVSAATPAGQLSAGNQEPSA